MARRAAVDGRFYPANPAQLRDVLESCVGDTGAGEDALGLLSPHAGYVFSGAVAGKAFAAVRVPQTVLLLNPSHSYDRPALALWTGGEWLTPLGPVALHEALTSALAALPMVTPADMVHVPEHSAEVVLPFIQYCNPEASIAVICVTTSAGPDELEEFGAALPEVLAGCGAEDALVVASSDMSHEGGAGALHVVRTHDSLAIAQMEKLDPAGLYRVCQQSHITMCGVLPAVAMMASVAARGGTQGLLAARATSADSPHGSGDYVVGYAGMVFR